MNHMGEFISALELQRLVEVGLAAAHRGRVARARAVFEGLLTYDPAFRSARIGLAFTHLVVDEFERAEELLKNELPAGGPDDDEARALLALNYQLAGRSDEARVIQQELAGRAGAAGELARALLEAGK